MQTIQCARQDFFHFLRTVQCSAGGWSRKIGSWRVETNLHIKYTQEGDTLRA